MGDYITVRVKDINDYYNEQSNFQRIRYRVAIQDSDGDWNWHQYYDYTTCVVKTDQKVKLKNNTVSNKRLQIYLAGNHQDYGATVDYEVKDMHY